MARNRQKTWLIKEPVLRFQVADAQYPVMSATIASGPEAGRSVLLSFSPEELVALQKKAAEMITEIAWHRPIPNDEV